MSRRAQDRASFTEEDLCEFFQEVGNSQNLAHFYVETLGDEGFKTLRHRMAALKGENPAGDHELAALLGVSVLPPAEQKMLEINSLFKFFSRRKELLARSISAADAAELLGVSKQTIHDRIRENKLIGLVEANTMRLPIFQFDPSGQNGCVAGLSDVLKVMSGSLISKINWLVSSNAVFEGKAPIDILKNGDAEEVLREARSTGVA